MRILVVEDDVTSRAVLVKALENNGHDVVEAVDGLQAWDILQKPDAPRLVILDWVMPGMDGLEVLRRVREGETDRPPYILMVTGKGEKSDVITGLTSGADDYLTKPFDRGELEARVDVGRRMIALQEELAYKIDELGTAMEKIKTLQGVVPICSNCKKIRDDQGYWNQVEVYMRKHTEAELSHHICPDCEKIFSLDIGSDGEQKE